MDINAERFEWVMIADVHLRHPLDDRAVALHKLLEKLHDNPPERLILAGDIFDFFFARRSYYYSKYRDLLNKIKRLQDASTTVVLIEGNHEFDMKRLAKSGFLVIEDGQNYHFNTKDGRKYVVAHGDLVYAKPAYLRFRAFLKSRLIRFLAGCLPNVLLEGYALKHAALSRKHDRYRKLDHRKLLTTVSTWVRQQGCDAGLIGHFHVPYLENVEGVMVGSVTSWDLINFLAYTNGKFYRGRYSQGDWRCEEASFSRFFP